MRILSLVSLVAAVGTAPGILSAGQLEDSFAVRRFNDRIAGYMALRNQVVQRLGPPVLSNEPSQIVTREAALARALTKARPRADRGDIFDPAVSHEFRGRIVRLLNSRNLSASRLADSYERDVEPNAAPMHVNGTFDWRFGATMPAAVLDALPAVPWPLEYRFVCRDLVLLDVDANLIVDILPDVLTES